MGTSAGPARPAPAPAADRDTLAADSAAGGEEAAPAPPAAAADPARDSAAEPRPTLEELAEAGPTYVPYDRGPTLRPGEWLPGLLQSALAPVVEREDLPPETYAIYWVLVDREGTVTETVLQTSSNSEPFDRAARAVARRLRYRPAVAAGRRVPVWVLARVSLAMR